MVRFMRRTGTSVSGRVGRRGAALLNLGGMYFLLGLGYFVTGSESDTTHTTYAFPVLLTGSMEAWGGVFIAIGLVTCVIAFWPPGKDAWGFMVQAGMGILWAGFGICSMFVGGTRGWIIAVLFICYTNLVLVIAGMKGEHDEVA